jgi:uncharacterized protein (DUF427 family)
MVKSPGHQQWPEHRIISKQLQKRMLVTVDGEVLADSDNVIQVDEDGNPTRFYFPRTDVRMDKLMPSKTTSECPFKGHATYFGVDAGRKRLVDAVWSYEQPYEEHANLEQRLAFYADKLPAIEIRPAEEMQGGH